MITDTRFSYFNIRDLKFIVGINVGDGGEDPSAQVHIKIVHTAPCCPTTSSLQQRFGLSTDLTPLICHSVLLMILLLFFIRAMCPAYFHVALVTRWTICVALVLCQMTVLRILTFSLTFSVFLSMASWLVSSFFTNAFVRHHVRHPYIIVGKTYWLNIFLLDSWEGACPERRLCPFLKYPILLLFFLKLLALFCFPLLLVVPNIYS